MRRRRLAMHPLRDPEARWFSHRGQFGRFDSRAPPPQKIHCLVLPSRRKKHATLQAAGSRVRQARVGRHRLTPEWRSAFLADSHSRPRYATRLVRWTSFRHSFAQTWFWRLPGPGLEWDLTRKRPGGLDRNG